MGAVHPSKPVVSSLPRVSFGTSCFALVALAFAPLLACASFKPVAYEPQPARSQDPAAEIKTIIQTNTARGCITQPDFAQNVLIVKVACSNGIGNSVLHFDRVASIRLEQRGEWYRVLVTHNDGSPEFRLSSKSLTDMQRFDDAVTALTRAATNKAAPSAPATGTSL